MNVLRQANQYIAPELQEMVRYGGGGGGGESWQRPLIYSNLAGRRGGWGRGGGRGGGGYGRGASQTGSNSFALGGGRGGSRW